MNRSAIASRFARAAGRLGPALDDVHLLHRPVLPVVLHVVLVGGELARPGVVVAHAHLLELVQARVDGGQRVRVDRVLDDDELHTTERVG